jgi:hypothetical protein
MLRDEARQVPIDSVRRGPDLRSADGILRDMGDDYVTERVVLVKTHPSPPQETTPVTHSLKCSGCKPLAGSPHPPRRVAAIGPRRIEA